MSSKLIVLSAVYIRYCAYFVAVTQFLAPCCPATENQIVYRSSNDLDGDRYETVVSVSDLPADRRWSVSEASPPLQLRKAILLASAYINHKFASYGPWVFERIILQPVYKDDHWIYIVEFARSSKEGFRMGPQLPFGVVVLMNGKVLETAKVDRSK